MNCLFKIVEFSYMKQQVNFQIGPIFFVLRLVINIFSTAMPFEIYWVWSQYPWMLGEIICDAKNVFSGQQFSSPDHIIIYKGLYLNILHGNTFVHENYYYCSCSNFITYVICNDNRYLLINS